MATSNNPWTSIADLMSGFVVIVLVLFAAAVSIPKFKPPPPVPKVDPLRQQEERREVFLSALNTSLNPYMAQGLVSFDPKKRVIEFEDMSFGVGSACLTEQAAKAVDAVVAIIAERLEHDPNLTIHVEGHTDPRPVPKLTKACGWFADNTQLSTLRAANVRNRIGAKVSVETLARLPVTGWGADRLRNREDTNAAENRRVELHFVWTGGLTKTPSAAPAAALAEQAQRVTPPVQTP